MPMLKRILPLLLILEACRPSEKNWVIQAPAGDQYTAIQTNGKTVIPNGRLVTPLGKQIRIAPHPFGLVLSPDGNKIITANSGTGPFSISVITNLESNHPQVRQIPEGAKTDEGLLAAVFMGLAVAPDNKTVFVSGGQENKIYRFDLDTGQKTGEINCAVTFDNRDFSDGYIGDMVMTADGKTIYAVDQIGFRVVQIDVENLKVVENLSSGRYPFGIALSPDGKKLLVANVGMFEYSYIRSLDPKRLKETALRFPAFAYGSKEMIEGIKNDTLDVPGLGEMDSEKSFSVWHYDLSGIKPVIRAKVRTGVEVGEAIEGIPAVGGSSPNSIVCTSDFAFVSNGNNDNISVIDLKSNTIKKEISLQLDPRLGRLKGIIPFGLALSPNGRRLYAAESGINAVAVIDVENLSVLGHLPTGWFPSKIRLTPDGKKLIVANAKGFGSGPNGGKNFTAGPEGSYIGNLMKGTVSVIDIPNDDQLKKLSNQVIENNFRFTPSKEFKNRDNPIPAFPGQTESPIRHIVFISKENRTYDEVFGQLAGGRGDSSMARYGRNVSFTSADGKRKIQAATVMPNHLALAERFSIGDNFYVDADVSADGHKWLAATYPNEWMETQHPASYGGKRTQKRESTAPGKFAITGASGAVYPEDYNQDGSLWDHLYRNKKEFFNFGFGVEFDAGSFSDSTFKYGGVRYLVNYPIPGPLFDRTSRLFPTYNMAIPDQFRADVFMREYRQRWLDKKIDPPAVITLQLLNDHGAGERLEAGFGFHESYMADNDLALGRVVAFLSATPHWKNMMIVVTEDDAQGGKDHIDAHRSLLLVISPYSKKQYVSHQHSSFGSIFKTFWNVLGIPPLNQYDAGATDLSDHFSSMPDFTPYKTIPVDPRIFDPAKALTPLNEKFDWKAVFDSPELDDPEDMKKFADQKKESGRN